MDDDYYARKARQRAEVLSVLWALTWRIGLVTLYLVLLSNLYASGENA